MVDGRGVFEWSQTSHLLALHVNLNRKKGASLIDPKTLNPFICRDEPAVERIQLNTEDSMELLKSVFFRGKT